MPNISEHESSSAGSSCCCESREEYHVSVLVCRCIVCVSITPQVKCEHARLGNSAEYHLHVIQLTRSSTNYRIVSPGSTPFQRKQGAKIKRDTGNMKKRRSKRDRKPLSKVTSKSGARENEIFLKESWSNQLLRERPAKRKKRENKSSMTMGVMARQTKQKIKTKRKIGSHGPKIFLNYTYPSSSKNGNILNCT